LIDPLSVAATTPWRGALLWRGALGTYQGATPSKTGLTIVQAIVEEWVNMTTN